MLHVVTVHWNSEQWIAPQLHHIREHFPPDTRVYAALSGVPVDRHREFAYAEDLSGTHPDKLDVLARVVMDEADERDLLVFLDGDAFPIAPLPSDLLDSAPLAAVRRDENLGERYPHPCFAVTTVGFWDRITGSWQPGPIVANALGQPITDVGCSLLRNLEDRGEHWTPLLRSNVVDLHPLWFGIYAGLVYHHGAGFRDRLEHVDGVGRKTINPRVAARATRSPTWIPLAHRAERSVRYRAAARRARRWHATMGSSADELSDVIFDDIIERPDSFTDRFTQWG
jgi:hypothetical protein